MPSRQKCLISLFGVVVALLLVALLSQHVWRPRMYREQDIESTNLQDVNRVEGKNTQLTTRSSELQPSNVMPSMHRGAVNANPDDLPMPSQQSTVADLVNKGFPIISNARKLVYTQTAAQSIPEVVADLGNIPMILIGAWPMDQKAPPNEIARYWQQITPSVKVLRLIEEGRKNPDMVSSLLRDAFEECLTDHDEVQQRCLQSWLEGREIGGTGVDDPYYREHRKYEEPCLELPRLHYVIYSSLYILFNIDRADPKLLVEWLLTERDERYHCIDMDVWLVDCYFRRSGEGSEAATKHADLTQGADISGRKVIESRWDAIWDIHDPLLKAQGVDLRDIETIEVLEIPPELPSTISREAKEEIIQSFLEHAEEISQ